MKAEKCVMFINNFDFDLDNDSLHSTLNSVMTISNLIDHQFQVNNDSSDQTLIILVCKDFSLNQKQWLIVQ